MTDILFGVLDPTTGESTHAPVAYVLHSSHHECVCPWCAEDLGAVVMPNGSTYMELYSRLFNKQALHMKLGCAQGMATEMMVEVIKK